MMTSRGCVHIRGTGTKYRSPFLFARNVGRLARNSFFVAQIFLAFWCYAVYFDDV